MFLKDVGNLWIGYLEDMIMKNWRILKVIGLLVVAFLLTSCGATDKAQHDVNKDFTYDELYSVDEQAGNDNYNIHVTGYKIVKDEDDMPAIVLYYDFGNKTEEEISPYDLYASGYQESNIPDGEEYLNEAYLSEDTDEELFDNIYETVQSGDSIKCAAAWKLRNNSHNVEIEYYDYDDEYVGMINLNIEKELKGDSNQL